MSGISHAPERRGTEGTWQVVCLDRIPFLFVKIEQLTIQVHSPQLQSHIQKLPDVLRPRRDLRQYGELCRCQLHVAYSWLSFRCPSPSPRLPAGKWSVRRPTRRESRSDWVIRRSRPCRHGVPAPARAFCCLRSQKR